MITIILTAVALVLAAVPRCCFAPTCVRIVATCGVECGKRWNGPSALGVDTGAQRESGIGAAVQAVLASQGVEFEV